MLSTEIQTENGKKNPLDQLKAQSTDSIMLLVMVLVIKKDKKNASQLKMNATKGASRASHVSTPILELFASL